MSSRRLDITILRLIWSKLSKVDRHIPPLAGQEAQAATTSPIRQVTIEDMTIRNHFRADIHVAQTRVVDFYIHDAPLGY
jgi:hypothetical protein